MAARDTRLIIAALLLPHTERQQDGQRWSLDQALDWAEALERRAAERDARKPRADAGQPRDRKPWYDQLSPGDRAFFDRFWRAYGLKVGKQDAAGAWLAISPTSTQAEQIIAAAAQDARGAVDGGAKRRDGTARKYAQGWLTSRRWEDAPAPTGPAVDRKSVAPGAQRPDGQAERIYRRNGLRQQIERMEHMGLPVPDALREQLAAAEAALEEPRHG
jgi:hypothetical protein